MPALAVLMPFVWAALRYFLIANIAGFVLRVLVALGINIVVLEPAIDTIMALLQGQFNVMPAVVASWFGFLNIDRFIGLLLSAYTIQQSANFVLRVNH